MSETAPAAGLLPPSARPGAIHLAAGDPELLAAFYGGDLGLERRVADAAAAAAAEVGASEGPVIALGARDGDEALVVLHGRPGAPARRPGEPGLFHLALRVPRRRDLGAVFLRLRDRGVPLQGASDHAVSEALYLADPEGNGLEIYADRAREAWPREGGRIAMTTEPLDLRSLLGEAEGRAAPLPAGADLGHVHLQVTDLAAARAFYGPAGLGFELMVEEYPGALFFAAGGYHHHLGVNTWGVSRPGAPGRRGLLAWTLVLDGEAPAAAARRVGAEPIGRAWRADDPAGNRLVLTTRG